MINRTRKWVYILYSILAYIFPMAILIGAKHDVYFKTTTSSVTVTGIIIFAILLIVLKNQLSKYPVIPIIIGHIAVIVVMLLPKIIADEVILALSVSLVGIVMSCVFDRVAQFYARTSYNADGTLNKKAIPQKQAWSEAYCFGLKLDKE